MCIKYVFKTYCKCSFFVQADESGLLQSKQTKMCQCNWDCVSLPIEVAAKVLMAYCRDLIPSLYQQPWAGNRALPNSVILYYQVSVSCQLSLAGSNRVKWGVNFNPQIAFQCVCTLGLSKTFVTIPAIIWFFSGMNKGRNSSNLI